MSCPICDNKPANCDCSSEAIRLHEENESLKLQVDEAREFVRRGLAAELHHGYTTCCDGCNADRGCWACKAENFVKA